MSVPIPVISNANIKPNASRRKLKLIPTWGNHCQCSSRTWPLKTGFAWVSNRIKLVKLTPIAPKAVTPREKCFSQETSIVPKINGKNIIIGSTLVSNIWIGQNLDEPYFPQSKDHKNVIQTAQSKETEKCEKTKLCCATCNAYCRKLDIWNLNRN